MDIHIKSNLWKQSLARRTEKLLGWGWIANAAGGSGGCNGPEWGLSWRRSGVGPAESLMCVCICVCLCVGESCSEPWTKCCPHVNTEAWHIYTQSSSSSSLALFLFLSRFSHFLVLCDLSMYLSSTWNSFQCFVCTSLPPGSCSLSGNRSKKK